VHNITDRLDEWAAWYDARPWWVKLSGAAAFVAASLYVVLRYPPH
jgi:hypothetical protein